MEMLVTRCTGLDVHQKNIVVCVMTGEADEAPRTETRTYQP
jgi:transposase